MQRDEISARGWHGTTGGRCTAEMHCTIHIDSSGALLYSMGWCNDRLSPSDKGFQTKDIFIILGLCNNNTIYPVYHMYI